MKLKIYSRIKKARPALAHTNKNVIFGLLILTGGLGGLNNAQAMTFNKLVDSLDQVPGSATGEKFKLGYTALNGNVLAFVDFGQKTLWSMAVNRVLC